FSSRRRHTRSTRDWSSDVCSSDLGENVFDGQQARGFGGLGVLDHLARGAVLYDTAGVEQDQLIGGGVAEVEILSNEEDGAGKGRSEERRVGEGGGGGGGRRMWKKQ